MKNLETTQKIAKGESFILDMQEEKEICLKHSDDPELLSKIIDNLKVTVKPDSIRKYFQEDKAERQVLNVTIERNGKKMDFNFGMSIVDTAKIRLIKNKILMFGFNIVENIEDIKILFNAKKSYEVYNLFTDSYPKLKPNHIAKLAINDLLYSFLTSLNFSTPLDFDDFCDDFGYDNDSMKAHKIWEDCLKQESQLQKLFTDEERQSFPS